MGFMDEVANQHWSTDEMKAEMERCMSLLKEGRIAVVFTDNGLTPEIIDLTRTRKMEQERQWQNELPKKYRDELVAMIPEGYPLQAESIGQFLSLVMRSFLLKDYESWDELARRYAKEGTHPFHVTYWIDKDLSEGETVEALDVSHAVDLVQLKNGIPESHVIYVHNQNSTFNPNIYNHERRVHRTQVR